MTRKKPPWLEGENETERRIICAAQARVGFMLPVVRNVDVSLHQSPSKLDVIVIPLQEGLKSHWIECWTTV